MTNIEVIRRLTPYGMARFIIFLQRGGLDYCPERCSAFLPADKNALLYDRGNGCVECMLDLLREDATERHGVWDKYVEGQKGLFPVEGDE